jgi:hypothetical protein
MEVLIIGLLFYFIPTITANVREHNNTAAIVVTNLLLGWTVVGWVAALIWSCTDNTKGVTK